MTTHGQRPKRIDPQRYGFLNESQMAFMGALAFLILLGMGVYLYEVRAVALSNLMVAEDFLSKTLTQKEIANSAEISDLLWKRDALQTAWQGSFLSLILIAALWAWVVCRLLARYGLVVKSLFVTATAVGFILGCTTLGYRTLTFVQDRISPFKVETLSLSGKAG